MPRVDRETAELAKERANKESTKPYDPVSILCPACNEPVTDCEPNPNEYVPEETEAYLNDRAAFEFSPAKLMDRNHPNPWDKVHIVPKRIELTGRDGELRELLEVTAYKHDHSTEGYQLWEEQIEEIKENERRAEENRGLDDYATDGGDA